MPKLPKQKSFLDLSDYARLPARLLVKIFINTKMDAITFTWLFTLAGISASLIILNEGNLVVAGILLLIKSMLDAADGEIARERNHPSYVGRYLDSVNDFIVNLFLFISIGIVTNTPAIFVLIALVLFQLQGSLYTYYYIIKRHQCDGDKTSRIDEKEMPEPYPRDNPKTLKFLHSAFVFIYGWQDDFIHKLDPEVCNTKELPGWFMTLTSILGLGFQLLAISIMLFINRIDLIIPVFIFSFTLYGAALITIRKKMIK